jgi:hypothetical protein
VSHLHSLQSYTFVTTTTYYTLTLTHFSAINYCLKLSQTLHLHTSKLSPRTYSANSLLKTAPYKLFLTTPLANCYLQAETKPVNRFAYIARTSETKKRSQSTLLRQVTVFTRRYLGSERAAVWRHRGMLRRSARCGSALYGTARRRHRLPHRRAARTRSRGV